jgi:hypothetical protein
MLQFAAIMNLRLRGTKTGRVIRIGRIGLHHRRAFNFRPTDTKKSDMKRLPTVIVTLVALHLTALPVCDAGNLGCLLKRRVLNPCAKTNCGPSSLNIQLTGQIVALREELEELQLASAEKDAAIEESKLLMAAQQEEAAQQQEKLAQESKRAAKSEKALAAARKNLAQGKKSMAAAKAAASESLAQSKKQAATLQENLKKARQRNANLKKQLDKSKQALEAESEQKEEERRPEEQAIETPPAKEESATPEDQADTDK